MSVDPLFEARTRQLRAAARGFDWADLDGVWDKLDEEVAELKAATTLEDRREELGDLLFMLVNASRHLGIDASEAMARASDKFDRRFASVLAQMAERGRPEATLSAADLEAMEACWQHAKQMEAETTGQ